MSAQINEQFTTFTHQFAAAAARANRLALENAETVSYTHLDVYKRQVTSSRSLGSIVPEWLWRNVSVGSMSYTQ